MKQTSPVAPGMARGIVGIILATGIGACVPEPLEFADWTIPVAEGTRVIDYAPVPLGNRVGQIELVADLTLEGNPDAPEENFYRPTGLAVAGDGRMFVFEWGDMHIFSADGEHLVTIGREGQGPGEMQNGGRIAVARNFDVDWPELNPALSTTQGTGGRPSLYVDGHGHLYVFPFVRDPIDDRYPVDVYDAEGERLFAGWIGVNEWRDSLDDCVYGFDTRESDEETVVVRYRLAEPFSDRR